jgi:hypothetical protein
MHEPIIQQTDARAARLDKVDDRATVHVGEYGNGRLRVRSEKWGGRAWLDLSPVGTKPKKQKPWKLSPAGDALEIETEGKRGKQNRGVTTRIKSGSLEWDEIFATAADLPKEPYVAYDVTNPPGLTFHYQPELTPKEIAEGAYRAPNIVGSYAVYWPQSGRILRPDGTERINYETGKFCHIPRPEWIDAAGNRLWGEQAIDAGQLRIAVPTLWLGMAERQWPVTLDPTFGYESIGATLLNYSANYIFAHGPHTLPSAGTADSVSVYTRTAGVSLTTGLYADSGGAPASLHTDSAGGASLLNDWTTQAMDAPAAISGIAWIAVRTAGLLATNRDTVAGIGDYYKSSAYSAGQLDNPFETPGGTQASYAFSIYATYTEAATGNRRRRVICGS